MTITQILYALTTAQRKNISKAADELFVSQSALSQQLQKLEKELGCKLFLRDSRPIELTPAGETFLKWATRLSEDVKLMREDMEKARLWVSRAAAQGHQNAAAFMEDNNWK